MPNQILKPPTKLQTRKNKFSVFLAGSIEMGKAEDWQTKVTTSLDDYSVDITIFNPRRDDWDSSWKQTIHEKQFVEQVEWELNALETADIVIMYLDPNTQSPISLLEFGLFARSSKMILYCPEGFWRKGNVDVTSRKYNVRQVKNFDNLIEAVKKRLDDIQSNRKFKKMIFGIGLLFLLGGIVISTARKKIMKK